MPRGSVVEREDTMPSENLQNSADGMLTQSRNWRQSTVCSGWPAPGLLSGYPGLCAGHSCLLALIRVKGEMSQWERLAFLARSQSRGAQSLLILSVLQTKNNSPG